MKRLSNRIRTTGLAIAVGVFALGNGGRLGSGEVPGLEAELK